jgi:hypothetical protein
MEEFLPTIRFYLFVNCSLFTAKSYNFGNPSLNFKMFKPGKYLHILAPKFLGVLPNK